MTDYGRPRSTQQRSCCSQRNSTIPVPCTSINGCKHDPGDGCPLLFSFGGTYPPRRCENDTVADHCLHSILLFPFININHLISSIIICCASVLLQLLYFVYDSTDPPPITSSLNHFPIITLPPQKTGLVEYMKDIFESVQKREMNDSDSREYPRPTLVLPHFRL